MEKKENLHNSTWNTSSSNIKKLFWWWILWILLLTSCQESKDNKVQENQKNEIEIVWNNTQKIRDIQEPREYKIYKLWLGSKVKIANTPELSENLKWKDIEFKTILPSIIKESMMSNDARSNSWAVGYFQLKPIAIKDVIDYYNIKDLKLDANNPVDNVILWSLYRIRSLNLLKEWLNADLSDDDLEKMMILSYNAWPARIKSLFKESKATNYKDFEKYLAKKIWVRENPTRKTDKTYWVEYTDPLTNLNLDNLRTREDKKIAEGLRYVAIIDGISWYINSNNTIQILWKITCDKDLTLFSIIKNLREQGVFKKDSSINEICKIILETNWYSEKETPIWVDLLLIKNALIDYLP